MAKVSWQLGAIELKGLSTHVEYDVSEEPDISGESRVGSTKFDANYDTVTPSNAKNNFRLVPNNIGYDGYSLLTSNPAIATIEDTNKVVWAGDGDVEIYLQSNSYGTKRHFRNMTSTGSDPTLDVTSYQAGSLAEHVWSQVTALLSGLSPLKSVMSMWSSNNHDTDSPAATLNPSLFAAGLDLTGIPCMTDANVDDRYIPVAVTLRHGIIARHVQGHMSVGTKVVWKLAGGTYFEAIISAITNVTREMTVDGESDTATPDIAVVYFDRDLTGVTQYKTPELGWGDKYIRSAIQQEQETSEPWFWGKIPVIRKTMHHVDESWGSAVQVNHLQNFNRHTTEQVPYPLGGMDGMNNIGINFDQSIMTTEGTAGWGIKAIGGDSGSPTFMLVNGELVFICTQYMSGISSDVSFYTNEINAIMDTQAGAPSGTWELTHYDFAGDGFTDYS